MPYQFDSDLSPPVRAHLLEGPQDINRAAFYNALERSYSGDPRQEEIAHNRVGMGGDQAPLCEAGRDLGAPISQEPVIAAIDEPTLAEKVTCLSWPDVYGKGTGAVSRRETLDARPPGSRLSR
jgi:hypothetical protein